MPNDIDDEKIHEARLFKAMHEDSILDESRSKMLLLNKSTDSATNGLLT